MSRRGLSNKLLAPAVRSVLPRRLRVELLETRRLLDASPWLNPTYARDVNNDGLVSPSDALAVINRLAVIGAGPLPDPGGQPHLYYDTNGDGLLSPSDLARIINRLLAPPQVTLTTLAPFTVDLTPQLQVAVTSPASVPNGTIVQIDVDLNNNGVYSGGELNYGQATIFNGTATFDLNPALPPSGQFSTYPIKMQAHIKDSDGLVGYSSPLPLLVDTQISTALADYVAAPDPSYGYTVAQVTPDPLGRFTIYDVKMTSQTWRSVADVNQPVWKHWVRIVIPSGAVPTTATLLIDGGSFSEANPAIDADVLNLAGLAVGMHSILIDLQDVPNEPLEFTGDTPTIDRSEDAIIAYTYDQYMDHIGQPGNDTWPALLPMVKSAVRAMDTAQQVVATINNGDIINNFLVTGYSKRGWTTWLTAAVDSRVVAIVPGVFDNLDQGVQMVHHYEAYGFFSPAVDDYNDLNIFGRMMTPEGEQLSRIVDPYRYLNNGRFANMPKLLINSAGDEFFVSDSAQYYFHDLPGTQNYLRYLPNTGHGLNDTDPGASTVSFYDAVVNNHPLPQFSWAVQPDGSIRVQTVTAPTQVLLWQATNPTARDFRHAYNPGIVWTSSILNSQGGGVYVGSTATPDNGATAFFVELTFPSSVPGDPFVFTTEIHVNTKLPLFPWPFPSGLDSLGTGGETTPLAESATAAASDGTLSATAFAVSLTSTELTSTAQWTSGGAGMSMTLYSLLPSATLLLPPIESTVSIDQPLMTLTSPGDSGTVFHPTDEVNYTEVSLEAALHDLLG